MAPGPPPPRPLNEGEPVSTNICAASHDRRWSQIQQEGGVLDFWKSNEDVSLVSFVCPSDQKPAHPKHQLASSPSLCPHLRGRKGGLSVLPQRSHLNHRRYQLRRMENQLQENAGAAAGVRLCSVISPRVLCFLLMPRSVSRSSCSE